MAYQIEKTYTSFGGGISDDDFLGTENSVKDLDSIDVQTQERYAQAVEAYVKNNEYDFYGGAPTWVKSTPYGVFRGNLSETLSTSGGQLSGIIGTTIDIMESYGAGSDQVNYFFHRTAGIKVTNYIGTTLLTGFTNPIIANYPTDNVEVTALGWHVTNLLFAKQNKIYYVDTATNTIPVASSTSIVTLTPGTIVKYIYSYSYDSTIVVTTNGDSTYIYELEFTGGGYNIVSKMEEKSYKCIDAVGNAYDLYWISTDGIHQYQGRQSQFIKKVSLASDAKIGYSKGPLVTSSSNIYKLSSTKPGRNKILTRYDTANNIYAVDLAIILVQGTGSKSAVLVQAGAYKRTNTIELLPIDGGILQIPKQDLNFRFGYLFGSGTYTNSATRQAIVVKIQTDGMAMINSSTFVEVSRVTDGDTVDTLGNKKYGYMEINPDMVVTALTTAGYTTEFGWVKVKIEILAGDEYASPAGFYRKTPQLFDFTCKANFVKNL